MQLAPNFATWNRLKAVAIGTTLLTLSLSHSAMAQEKLLRTLTVTGQGVESIPTTEAQVQLGVEAEGKTAEAAQQEATRRSNAVVSLLRSRNVDKLETTGITLNPVYRQDNKNRQILDKYTATNTVSFRIATTKAGALVDAAVQAGANRINGVSFVAADAAIELAGQEALRKATLAAQSQAQVVLKTLGVTQLEVVSVNVNGAFAPQPQVLQMQNFSTTTRLAGEVIFALDLIGGEQKINSSVTLQVRY